MLWTVRFRTKEGALEQREVEAANRAIVISDMRAEGCVVLNIAESTGGEKKKQKVSAFAEAMKSLAIILLILVGAIVAFGAWRYHKTGKVIEMKELKAPLRSPRSSGSIRINVVSPEEPAPAPKQSPRR